MATPNSLKHTYLEYVTGSGGAAVTVSFLFQQNPENYTAEIVDAVAGLTVAGTTANPITATERSKVADVVVPVSSLIKSGNFRRLVASGKDGVRRLTRSLIVPSAGYEAIKNLIESGTGVVIGGVTCTSVEVGQRASIR